MNAKSWSAKELLLLHQNIGKGNKYLAENIFPAKTRSPDNICLMKSKLERAPNRKTLDLDEVFKNISVDDFYSAVERNRTGRPNQYGKTVVWEGVAAELNIPHVTAKICQD